MPLFKITVKRSALRCGVRLEKGMSVDVASASDPVSANGGKDAVDAFKRIYGIDLKQASALSRGYLDVTKIN